MKYTAYLFTLLSSVITSQENVAAIFSEKISIKVDQLASVDNFETIYFIKDNVFYKKDRSKKITYNNLQLGNLTTANAFNPLKMNLFYQDFNTLIVLDNRLAEIFKIDFNRLQPYKNISHISSGFDNTIWLFNQDLQQLELYDYKTGTTRAQSVPIQSEVLDLKSNYNNCWLLTKNYLYVFNYFGNLLGKIKNDEYEELIETNGNIILRKQNTLYFLKDVKDNPIEIEIPNLLINQFFVTNETLYIYQHESLQKFQLKIN